jgi:cytochrome P450
MPPTPDPFRAARESAGVLPADFRGEQVLMLLRHRDVRTAALDWKTYSSDAPGRVPVPSEEHVRSVRQLPIETDPPDHAEYRRVADPFFARPKDPAMIAAVAALVDELVSTALARPDTEVVRDFALPLQSYALALLLQVDRSEAEEWISWGTHVFHARPDGEPPGAALERYLARRLDRAAASPGEDFFSALTRATVRGRPLTRPEMMGFANLVFAGGRDTLIHTFAGIFAHFARVPTDLARLRAEPDLINPAAEEFFRVQSVLTQIGRVCPHGATVHGHAVPPDARVSLCFASANRDASVFPAPEETRLDRKPNPHVAFGSGPHTCLGALHARLLTRTLLTALARRVAQIEICAATPHVETESAYARESGFDQLIVRLRPLSPS